MSAHLRAQWRMAAYQMPVSIAEQQVSDWGPNYVGQDTIERQALLILRREGWMKPLHVRSSPSYDSFFDPGKAGADAEAFVSEPVDNATGQTLPGALMVARSAGMKRLVLIHECAHILAGFGAGHGGEFVRIYLRLLRKDGMDGAANLIGFMTGIEAPKIVFEETPR